MVEIEVAEDGTLTVPADAMRNVRPRTRYRLEKVGQDMVLHQERSEVKSDSETSDEWWTRFQAYSEAVSNASITDESAVDVLSEMRR